MADFNSRISQIRTDLDSLLSTLTAMDERLKTAAGDFESLASNAKEISTLSTAIQRLSKFLGQENSPLLDSLKSRITEINTELTHLNVGQLQNATTALETNAKALAAISRAQANINRNMETAKTVIGSVRAELDQLDAKTGTVGTGLEASIGRIVESMNRLSNLSNVQAPITALNELNPIKYNQAADALDRIKATVEELKQANLTIDVSQAAEGQKLTKKPITPVVRGTEIELPAVAPNNAPPRARPRTVQYAQEQGIDLSQVTGTGSHGVITKEDVLKYRQSSVSSSDANAAVETSRAELEKKTAALTKLNAALDQIEKAQLAVLQKTARDYGIKTAGQLETAQEYLLPSAGARPDQKYQSGRNFRESFKEAGIIEADFKSNLANAPEVETGLPGDFEKLKVSDIELINKLKEYRKRIADEISRLSKIEDGPSFSLSHTANALRKRFDRGATEDDLAINTQAEAGVLRDRGSNAYYTRGNGRAGATAQEASANLAALNRAVDESPHKIAVVTSVGSSAGGSSLIPGEKSADHVLLAYKDVDNRLRILEHLGDRANLSPGNKIGNVAGGAYAPERRTVEEFVLAADSIKALPLKAGTPDQARRLLEEQTRLTEPGKAIYSAASELNKSDLVDIGHTCASATAEAFKQSGILTTIKEESRFAGVPGTKGINVVTPREVLEKVEALNKGEITSKGELPLPSASAEEVDHELSILKQHLKVENDAIESELTRLKAKVAQTPDELPSVTEASIKKDVRNAYRRFDKSRDDLAASKERFNQREGERGLAAVEATLPDPLEATEAAKTFERAQRDILESEKIAAEELIRLKERFKQDPGSFSNEPITGSHKDFYDPNVYAGAQSELEDYKARFAERRGAETEPPKTSIIATATETLSDIPTATQTFVQRFLASIKNVFARINETFSELFGSVSKISFGDIATKIKGFFSQSSIAEREGPQFSLARPEFALSDVRDASDTFSKKVYRPFSFGVSQFGAGLNSVREVAKGLEGGGPGGLLDVIGGIIKFIHTFAQSNAYFGLNLLPKGIGELFNQRRSETLLDVAEFGVGIKTGYRRGDLNQSYRELKSKEEPLAERVKAEKQQLKKPGDLTEEQILALRQELAKDTEELKKLRQQINAYRVVLEQEAEEKAKGGFTSTGKELDASLAPSFSLDSSTQDTFGKIRQFMTEQQANLSKQATEALTRFSEGTGLKTGIGGGVALVDQAKTLDVTRQFYNNAAIGNIGAHQVQGLSVPVRDDTGDRISSVILTTVQNGVQKGFNRAEIIVHEATHELVEQAGREGKALYKGTGSDTSFTNKEAELARLRRLHDLTNPGGLDTLKTQAGGTGILASIGKKPDSLDYYFDPKEIFAHIGQALISGNTKLEAELKQLYGEDLYNNVVRTLEGTLPATFAPQYLAGLQAKFAQFNQDINSIVNQKTDADLVQKNISNAFGKVFSDLKIPPDIGKELTNRLQKLIPAVGDIASNPESLARIGEAGSKFLYNEGSFKDLAVKTLARSGGSTIATSAFNVLKNPSEQNFSTLLTDVKSSPQVVKDTIYSYVKQAVTGDITQGLFAKYTFNKGTGAVVGQLINQLAPEQANFRDLLNEEVQKKTGRNIQAGTFQQQASLDPSTGLQKFTLSALTADGAMVSLNARVDEFGHKKIDEPTKELGRFGEAFKQVTIGAFRQLGDQFTYGIVGAIQEMGHQLLSVQDELAEVANLFNKVGDAATKAKAQFLFESVGTAVKTGQGFDEAIQSNLKNFKTLGNVKDPTQRAVLANQISEVQLGAQTAFGLPLEQSLEAVPAILASIKNGMDGIVDPAEKTTAAVKELRAVMDEVVVATRATGADGTELITVYSRLAESAKEYGLNSKQLLGISATASVAIGRGPEETTNILKAFLEGSYLEANQSKFAKSNIPTKTFNKSTGNLENRSLEDILRDLYKLSQDETKNVEYSQLIQGIAGKKIAPDIQKIVSSFGRNYDQGQEALNQTQGGTFEKLVGQKSQTVTGSLNKLQATGTQLLGSVLVGTGAFDKLAKLFDTLADSAVKLTSFLNGNQAAIKGVVDAILPFVKIFLVNTATKDLNIFSPLAKGIQGLETKFSGTFAKIADFGRVGESSGTTVQKTLNLIGVALQELDAAFVRTGNIAQASFSKVAEEAAVVAQSANPSFALSAGGRSLESETPLADRLGNKKLNVNGITNYDLAQIRGEEISYGGSNLRGTADDIIAASARPSKLAQLRSSLRKPGEIAGSLVAPVAFDALSGGFNQDNLTNIGAGIVGGIVGGFTGGPAGSIVGYSIAKGIAEHFDLPGKLGTSDQEAQTFAEAIAEKLFNKKPPEGTPEEQQAARAGATSRLTGISDRLGVNPFIAQVNGIIQQSAIARGRGIAGSSVLDVSSEDVKSYLEFQQKNSGKVPGFLDNYKLNNAATGSAIGLFGGNKDLLDLFSRSGVSNIKEFLDQIQQATQGTGKLADSFAKLDTQQQQTIAQTAEKQKQDELQAVYESGQQAIDRTSTALQDVTQANSDRYSTPLGLDKYSPFGKQYQELQTGYNATLAQIKSGQLSGQPAQDALARYDKAFAAMEQLPATLQQLIPFAQANGLSTTGLDQKLYGAGAEGQQKLVQRFQPAIQADSFIREYEQKQRNLTSLRDTAGFKSGTDEAVIKQVAALEKALAVDKARYSINVAFLAAIKGQTNLLLDQTTALEEQNKTRQLISAGSPAQFTPASIFDTKGLGANQLNAAIDFALRKQSQLEKLNPNYKKEFAKDQFLLQSGTDYKGVTGVNQGFVQEYLQQQNQQQAPLEDLSKFSDQEISKILDQARTLQGQAEKLDPSRAGKYDSERLLILKKNNELLSQTGISQEFLKLAIQENTKSNDTLRGHYNLPSSYKAPTIFDYYDNGGKQKGDQNFPTLASQGLVPLSFAQQLANELIAGNKGDKGANLADIKSTSQPGARPLFYPTPGTGAVYSEPEPVKLTDTAPALPPTIAQQRYNEFKQKQIDELENPKGRRTGIPSSSVGGPDERGGSLLSTVKKDAADLSQSITTANQSITAFAGRPIQTATAGLQDLGTALPTATSTLNTGATTFLSTISQFAAKVGNIDLAEALKKSNITLQVTVNGQALPPSQVQVTATSTATGTSTLSAGPSVRTPRRGGLQGE